MNSREHSLNNFVEWYIRHQPGDEKGEAQIFLDRLFTAFGYADGIKGAAGVAEQRIRFTLDEKSPNSTRFADLVIPGRVLIEMKKRGENLSKHQQQALGYWLYLTPHPRYVVLCNFETFWVYDMERQIDEPMGIVRTDELAENWGPLAFLFPIPETPTFNKEFDLVELTQQAAYSLSQVFDRLAGNGRSARGIEREVAQRFILQCMVALFAENIGLLPRYTFTRVVDDCYENGANSHDLFFLMFAMMNVPGMKKAGRFYNVDYFNGGLFDIVHPLQLEKEELRLLREAANHNWARIRPAIFGAIFEGSMDSGTRHQTGAHFTTEVDIQRIVQPVIVQPWVARIMAAGHVAELRALQAELCTYRVLDPACGTGNFLYVAYRELKKLEQLILDRLRAVGDDNQPLCVVSPHQFYGLDVNSFAVELARTTLMIAKKLAVDDLHSPEPALPLDNLNTNILVDDALFAEWPLFDACIGNPPYLGAKRLKAERGMEYVNRLRAVFPDVPGNADYCVYWFRKTHDLMRPGTRAGLVGTNTIRQNYSRIGGLDHITAHDGQIYEAVPSMPWSGEAAVHVSIACWSRGEAPIAQGRLWLENGERLTEVALPINSSLSLKTDVSGAVRLACNMTPKRVFQGQIPGHEAFILQREEVINLVKKDRSNLTVIFPFLIGRDLVASPQSKPNRALC